VKSKKSKKETNFLFAKNPANSDFSTSRKKTELYNWLLTHAIFVKV
jgi:hypothetical protein